MFVIFSVKEKVICHMNRVNNSIKENLIVFLHFLHRKQSGISLGRKEEPVRPMVD